MIGKRKGAGASLLSNLAHIEMLAQQQDENHIYRNGCSLVALICQSKSDYIQAIAQDIIQI